MAAGSEEYCFSNSKQNMEEVSPLYLFPALCLHIRVFLDLLQTLQRALCKLFLQAVCNLKHSTFQITNRHLA